MVSTFCVSSVAEMTARPSNPLASRLR